MKNKYQKLIPACAILGVAIIAVVHYVTMDPLAQGLVGVDSSTSVKRNCGGLGQAAKAMLAGQPGIREGSQITVLAFGSDARDPEPVPLFNAPIPVPPDILIGKDDERFRRDEEAFYATIERMCDEAPASRISPIYELTKQGINHLRGTGCGPDGRCVFLLKSDLVEEWHPVLSALIRRAAKDPMADVPADLAGSIDNAGIEVQVCGIAEIRPGRETGVGPASPDTRARIWKELFTHPDLASFRPFCSK